MAFGLSPASPKLATLTSGLVPETIFSCCPMTTYQKVYVTIPDLIKDLIKNGLKISDVNHAAAVISSMGYTLFSSYCYHFERPPVGGQRTHRFLPNTTFEDIVKLIKFDEALRDLVFQAVRVIENKLRFELADTLAMLDGPHAYLNSSLFLNRAQLLKSLGKVAQSIS